MAEEPGKWGVEIPSPSSTEITEGQVLTASTAEELSSVDSATRWPSLETTCVTATFFFFPLSLQVKER